MRYISLTFDDGRQDNYSYANLILQDYHMKATLFCTTGFIDGTFDKPKDWKSAGEPLSIKELHELSNNGWEIALHGDRHVTSIDDSLESVKKIREMGFTKKVFGFSIPNSEIPQASFSEFKQRLYPNTLKYIRCGRAIDTSKLSSKLLFAIYNIVGVQRAYNSFNRKSVIKIDKYEACNLPSIVIRCNDKPQMILKFLENLPDNTWVIFMLHSVLPKSSSSYRSDPWNWSVDNFKCLIDGISRMKNISVDTVLGVLSSISERDGGYCEKNR